MSMFICSMLFYLLILKDSSGHRFKRLVGADDTAIEKVPYQASIRTNNYHICGGTIISPRHILSAAHCLYKLFEYPFQDLEVVTGTSTLDKSGNFHKVLNVSCHPNFQNGLEKSWFNDIAIITLEKDIEEDFHQKRVTLPSSPLPLDSKLLGVVSGWGREESDEPYLSHVLKKESLRVLSRNQCQNLHKQKLYDGQICAFGGKGKGICKGDSGGPLVINNAIIGISSWNIPCATGAPDVFTEVYKYLDFINGIVKSK